MRERRERVDVEFFGGESFDEAIEALLPEKGLQQSRRASSRRRVAHVETCIVSRRTGERRTRASWLFDCLRIDETLRHYTVCAKTALHA